MKSIHKDLLESKICRFGLSLEKNAYVDTLERRPHGRQNHGCVASHIGQMASDGQESQVFRTFYREKLILMSQVEELERFV